jgi:hypothetical protein
VSDALARGRQIAIELLDSARSDGLVMGLKGKAVRRALENLAKANDPDELTAFADELRLRFKSGVQRSVTDPGRLVIPVACVRDTGIPGLDDGVFAMRSFKSGECIETCSVIVLAVNRALMPKSLRMRFFSWGKLVDGEFGSNSQALALGFGSIYNHDNPSNMRYEAIREGALLRFVAVRDIAVYEELTVNYNAFGGGHEWHDDNWFVDNDVARVIRPK